MYCTRFTVNTPEVHSHISITCSNSRRILLGWGHVAEAFKLSRELGVHQHGPQAPGKQGQGSADLLEAAVALTVPAWLPLTLVFTPKELPTPQTWLLLAKLGLVSEQSCSPLLFCKVECVELGWRRLNKPRAPGRCSSGIAPNSCWTLPSPNCSSTRVFTLVSVALLAAERFKLRMKNTICSLNPKFRYKSWCLDGNCF